MAMIRRLLAALMLFLAPLLSADTLLVVGDSLSAGYGVEPGKGWVDLLADRLDEREVDWQVVNASISGDTTTGGAQRIDRAIAAHAPRLVVLELGGNDALRGQPLELMRRNLTHMVERSRAAGARVLLLGMRIPPNYGPAYTRAFRATYRTLSDTMRVPLVDFFLDGVALSDDLMQDDGIHPTTQAQPVMLENIWPMLEPLILEIEREG